MTPPVSATASTIPAVGALRSYTTEDFRGDLAGGLCVAAVAVPQAMAYALIAGLPPEMGLYTAIVMNVQEMSDNLKKYGNYIPGIRPGKPTYDYLERVISRITLCGAVFLAGIAVYAALQKIV